VGLPTIKEKMPMGHEPRGTSGTAVTVIVVVAVLAGLLVLGLLVLGLGAFFLVRSEARQVQQAVMAEQEAMSRLESARAEAERARRGPADLAAGTAGEACLVVTVDRASHLAVDGQVLTRDQLRQQISAAQDRGGPAVSVVIEAAEEAPFKAVADVQTLCHELGVRSVEMRLAPAAEETAEEPGEAP